MCNTSEQPTYLCIRTTPLLRMLYTYVFGSRVGSGGRPCRQNTPHSSIRCYLTIVQRRSLQGLFEYVEAQPLERMKDWGRILRVKHQCPSSPFTWSHRTSDTVTGVVLTGQLLGIGFVLPQDSTTCGTCWKPSCNCNRVTAHWRPQMYSPWLPLKHKLYHIYIYIYI